MNSEHETTVGIVGLGTVGSEVTRRLIQRTDALRMRTGRRIRVSDVAEMDMPEGLDPLLEDVTVYRDALRFVEEADCDIMVELIGGLEPAHTLITRAFERGMDVVTANKELLARRGESIFDHASENNQRIRFEASVGGCIPVIRTIREGMVDTDVEAIYGIINGTANYVLTRMEREDQPFAEALAVAQDEGYAEADPSYDVEGDDSAHKIAILAALSYGTRVEFDAIHCEGITRVTPAILRDARELGFTIKLLGVAKRTPEGLDVRVHPTMIPRDSALAAVQNEYNAVLLQGDPIGSSMLYGKGAGGRPTSTAIISDVVSLATRNNHTRHPVYFSGTSEPLVPIEQITSRYYLRLEADDHPGVLARVTSVLGEHDISIDSMIQRGRSTEEAVPVVMTTHEAREGPVQRAVEKLARLDVVETHPVCLRIEEDILRG